MLDITPAKNKIDLVPVKFQCDKSLGEVLEPLPSSCFFMLLCGRPASGKSTLCSNMLCKKELYKKKFDHIYLIMPNNSLASLPNNHPYNKHIKANPEKLYNDLNGPMLASILKSCQEASKEDETSLLVIDDMLHALKNQDVLDQMKFLASNRRHIKTSTIILTQVWNSVPTMIRKQISHAFIWRSSKKEFNSIYDEQFSGLSKEDAEDICEYAWNKPHGFLYINCTENTYYDKEFNQLKIA
jgi:hypothetical protein